MMKRKLRIIVLLHADLVPDLEYNEIDASYADWYTEYSVVTCLQGLGHEVQVIPIFDSLKPIREAKENFKPHIAFNLLEEFNGEAIFDSHVVSYLELLGLKYTGCNPRGLLLARDKALTKKILTYHRIPVPKFITMKRGKFKKVNKLEFPLFVKSLNEEASLGISKASLCREEKALKERVEFIFDKIGTDAIVEEFIEGRELYVGAIGNQRIEVLPPVELEFGKAENPEMQFATRSTKWNEKYRMRNKIELNLCKDLDNKTQKNIERIARRTFRALNLNSYARLDIRLKGDIPYILEANPNPAIAPEDEFSVMAMAKGYSYKTLIEKVLALGLA